MFLIVFFAMLFCENIKKMLMPGVSFMHEKCVPTLLTNDLIFFLFKDFILGQNRYLNSFFIFKV